MAHCILICDLFLRLFLNESCSIIFDMEMSFKCALSCILITYFHMKSCVPGPCSFSNKMISLTFAFVDQISLNNNKNREI